MAPVRLWLAFLAVFLGGGSLSSTFADSPYPFRVGSKWVFQHDSTTQETLVEAFTTIKTDQGQVQAAVLQKTGTIDRIVIRTAEEWIECQLKQDPKRGALCLNPFVFFRWPLAVDDRWTSRNFDFQALGRGTVQTPFKDFTNAWKIAYTPSGSPDPLGEFWFVEGVGRVRVREGEVDLELREFEAGTGPELQPSPNEAVRLLSSEGMEEVKPPEIRGTWQRMWVFLSESRVSPLFLIQALVLCVFLFLGIVLWRVLRSQKALLKTESQSESDVHAELKLLAALARGGETEGVEERLQKLVSKHPTYPDLLHQLALVQWASGRFDAALGNLGKAIAINPKYVDARLTLGNLLLEAGQAEKAVEHFVFVAEHRPQFADAHLGAGRSYLALKRLEDARRSLERALEINPNLDAAGQLLDECRKSA